MKRHQIHEFVFFAGLMSLLMYRHYVISYEEHRYAPGYDLTVLAFGDSLTRGFQKRSFTHHPYTMKFTDQINMMYPYKKINVINLGISGERVSEMYERLKTVLKSYDGTKHNVIAIILGGTNDYGDMMRTSQNITDQTLINQYLINASSKLYQQVVDMHSLCREKHVRSVLVTIPEVTIESLEAKKIYKHQRILINQKLILFVKQNDNVVFADLASFIERHENKLSLFADAVHFNHYGYDRMGEFLLNKTIKYLKTFSL